MESIVQRQQSKICNVQHTLHVVKLNLHCKAESSSLVHRSEDSSLVHPLSKRPSPTLATLLTLLILITRSDTYTCLKHIFVKKNRTFTCAKSDNVCKFKLRGVIQKSGLFMVRLTTGPYISVCGYENGPPYVVVDVKMVCSM